MKKIVLLSFLFATLFSHSQNFSWALKNGGIQEDVANAMAFDLTGNVYTTGKFEGAVDFDPGSAVLTLTSSGNSDVFVQKVSGAGTLIWAKKLGGIYSDNGVCISPDASGNVLVAGTFSGTANFHTGSGFTTLTSFGMTDIFICKLDGLGNLVWVKQLGGTQDDFVTSLTSDFPGNVYTTGSFAGTADFDPGVATQNFSSGGYSDIFISKLNSTGNFVWAKHFNGSTNANFGLGIQVDVSGNVFTSGSFFGTVDFDPGTSIFSLVAPGTLAPNCFISKLDQNGNFIWAKQFTGSSGCAGTALCIDASTNVFITGYFFGTIDFDPGIANNSLSSAFGFDIFIARLDASGNYTWAKKMGGSGGNDIGTGIDLDASGNVYTTGAFDGSGDFDPGSASYSLTSNGGDDSFISKLDGSGNFLWAKQLGGLNNDRGNAIRTYSLDVYITGYFQNNVDFDPGAGIFNLTSAGLSDAYLCKLSPICLTPSNPTNVTPLANMEVCDGSSAILSATSTGASIKWYTLPNSSTAISTGSVYTSPQLPIGTYTYYAEANSCTTSIGRTSIVFTVIASPTVTSISILSITCAGSTNTLIASGANSYTWSEGSLSNSVIINPTITSNYTVVGQSTVSGCTNKSVISALVSECLNLNDFENSNISILVYPNPSSGYLNLKSNQAIQLLLINSVGQLIKTIDLNMANNFFSTISELQSGLYFITGNGKQRTINEKLFVYY